MGAGGAPHQFGATLEAQLMRGALVVEGEGLPGRMVGADLFGSGSGKSVSAAAAAGFRRLRIRQEQQLGILAEAADGGGFRGKVAEDGLVGVASVEGDHPSARGGGGLGVERGTQIADLFAGALAEAGGANFGTIPLPLGVGGLLGRLGESGSVAEGDGQHAAGAVGSREGERSLQKALSAHEVGLERRAERIASPGDSGSAQAGAAQKRIIKDGADRSLRRQLGQHGAANHGEEGFDGQAVLGEESVTGGPVTKLRAASGEQAGHGMTSQTKQRAQRESLGVRGESALMEAGAALAPELLELGEDAGRVFFRTEGGVEARRSASSPLSSTNHSTVSPRENSMAWARAEGKLMYHCSLAWRLMSWTLVGNPMEKPPFEI